MHRSIASLLALAIAMTALPSQAQRAITIRRKVGSVTTRDGSRVRNAFRGQKLTEGEALTTGGYSPAAKQHAKAALSLDLNQGTVLIGPRTRFVIRKLGYKRNGAITQLSVDYGHLWAQIRRFTNPYSEFSILWPDGNRQVIRGTSIGASWQNNQGVLITATGSVAVFDGRFSTAVAAGEGVLLKGGKVWGPYATRQSLSIVNFQERRRGAWLELSGQVVVKHCIDDQCVFEPVPDAIAAYAGRVQQAEKGEFSIRLKPPVTGNSNFLQIRSGGRRSTIYLNGGLLPRHP